MPGAGLPRRDPAVVAVGVRGRARVDRIARTRRSDAHCLHSRRSVSGRRGVEPSGDAPRVPRRANRLRRPAPRRHALDDAEHPEGAVEAVWDRHVQGRVCSTEVEAGGWRLGQRGSFGAALPYWRSRKSVLISANGMMLSRLVKRPSVAISFAASMKQRPRGARQRRPDADPAHAQVAQFREASDRYRRPTSTFTGFGATAVVSVRMFSAPMDAGREEARQRRLPRTPVAVESIPSADRRGRRETLGPGRQQHTAWRTRRSRPRGRNALCRRAAVRRAGEPLVSVDSSTDRPATPVSTHSRTLSGHIFRFAAVARLEIRADGNANGRDDMRRG